MLFLIFCHIMLQCLTFILKVAKVSNYEVNVGECNPLKAKTSGVRLF